MNDCFEQGPIRPPSEAGSLLVRVSRNCPWNKCAFCSVYKGERFSLRSVDEVVADLDAMLERFGDEVRTIFLQDANPLLTKPDDLILILDAIRARFPKARRITAYARSHTLARRSPEDLRRLREAGLDRLHVGMESGCDAVLEMVRKGTTRLEQIEAGRRVVAAGFELSEYWMPGLGGREHTAAHAADSAAAIREISPTFVRLRSTAVLRGTPLAALRDAGTFTPLGELEMVDEIRRFLDGLGDLSVRIKSDHMLNLLMEIQGHLPRDRDRLLRVCDELLDAPEEVQRLFVLARRTGHQGVSLRDLEDGATRQRFEEAFSELLDPQVDLDEMLNRIRGRIL